MLFFHIFCYIFKPQMNFGLILLLTLIYCVHSYLNLQDIFNELKTKVSKCISSLDCKDEFLYCHTETGTCLSKRPISSPCHENYECIKGTYCFAKKCRDLVKEKQSTKHLYATIKYIRSFLNIKRLMTMMPFKLNHPNDNHLMVK